MATDSTDLKGDEAGDATPAPPASTKDLAVVKETVATIIALLVTVLTMWMLYSTYIDAGEKLQVTEQNLRQDEVYKENEKLRLERQSSRKDVLLLSLGLFGTVMGYYFGRVPAERRAEKAEDSAERSESTARKAVQTATQAEQQRMLEELGREEAEALLDDTVATIESSEKALESLAAASPKTARATLSSGGQLSADQTGVMMAQDQLVQLKQRIQRRRRK